MHRLQQLANRVQIDKRLIDVDIVSVHNLSYRHRTLSDFWVGYLFVHLSGYNCIQKLHMGLAKHVHLSGLCTYPVCTYPGFTVVLFSYFFVGSSCYTSE